MSIFQDRLKQLIDEKRVKAADISRGTGLGTATISKYLSNDKKEPRIDCVIKLAEYFNVSLKWLCGIVDSRDKVYQSEFIDIYEKLSDKNKEKVYDYLMYLLEKD